MINTGIPKEKHQFTMSTTAGWKLQMAILTIPMMMMITRDKVDFCFSVASIPTDKTINSTFFNMHIDTVHSFMVSILLSQISCFQ